MILDGISLREYARWQSARWHSISTFLAFIERKTGSTILFDRRRFSHGRPDLTAPSAVASLLRKANIIRSYSRLAALLPDEPPIKSWSCRLARESSDENKFTGGAAAEDDNDALYAALAEALERHLWYTQTDHFLKPLFATKAEIVRKGHCIAPEKFIGFSDAQRAQNPKIALTPSTAYLWTQGVSLLNGKKIYLPAQIVSAAAWSRKKHPEPLIRMVTTIGLATWPEQTEARLRGALECIERDAYTIMWLNQLTLPRISLKPVRKKNPAIDLLLERCERYRLKVDAVQLITDAPTHAILVVVEDMSGHAPRFTLGLKMHRSLSHAIEKALLEALRARRTFRARVARGERWSPETPVAKIGHSERTMYWAEKEHAEKLTWMTQGAEMEPPAALWDSDTAQEHLQRIVDWCRAKEYECVALSLGTSKANPTSWHVEMVVMPDLQPAYLHESKRHITGPRLSEIPRQFGYAPREAPYIEGPHPFA